MKIFDNHCHVCFPQPIDETVEGFREAVEKLGIDEIGLLSCPRTSHCETVPDILENLKMLYIKEKLDMPVFAYAGFTYHCDDCMYYYDFAGRAVALGFDGFKTLEQHPRLRLAIGKGLNHPSFDRYFEVMEREHMPMVCHVGDPITNWTYETAAVSDGRFYGPEYPTLEQLYAETEEMLARHPGAQIILAHFYFMSDQPERLTAFMDRYPNAYLDLTPGIQMYLSFTKDPAYWRAFFLRYQDRIILGSDLYGAGYGEGRHCVARDFVRETKPFINPDGTQTIIPAGLPEDVQEKIFAGNAHRLVGETPRPVNRALAAERCREIEKDHWQELTELGKQNLKTFLDFWG